MIGAPVLRRTAAAVLIEEEGWRRFVVWLASVANMIGDW